MNDSTTTLWQEPGVRYYLGICCAGIGVLFPVLNQRGVDLGSMYIILFVALFGVGALLARPPAGMMRSLLDSIALRTPLIFLVTLLVLFTTRENRVLMFAAGNLRLSDLLLCAGVLGFVAGHYRLQAVVRNVFPEAVTPAEEAEAERRRDPERRGDGETERQRDRERQTEDPVSPSLGLSISPSSSPPSRRSGNSVTPAEVGWLLLALPAWAALAQLLAEALPTSRGNPGLMPEAWRVVTLAWLLGAIGLLVSSMLDYYHRRNMSPAEATLYLQDVAWHETRREQRRINRWAAWGRLGCPQSIFSGMSDWTGFLALASLIAAGVMAAIYLIGLLE
jgi:hypothetical protein